LDDSGGAIGAIGAIGADGAPATDGMAPAGAGVDPGAGRRLEAAELLRRDRRRMDDCVTSP
jgi:hypothetical protein